MKHTKTILSLLLLSIVILQSCSKEQATDAFLVQDVVSQSFGDDIDRPMLERDRLRFRDVQHFENYYLMLDDLFDRSGEQFDLLASSNESINTVHTILKNDRFSNPDYRYQPFLTDPIMMAIVNEHFEFQVGNILVTYINNEDVLMSNPNDAQTQSEIRALPKGGEISIDDIPEKCVMKDDHNIEGFMLTGCNTLLEAEDLECDSLKIIVGFYDDNFDPQSGRIIIYRTNSPTFPTSGTPIVDDHFTGFRGYIYIDATTPPQNRFFHARAIPDCATAPTLTETVEFIDDENICDNDERDTGWLWEANGIHGFSHITSFYKNWFRAYYKSRMISKRWNGSEWEKRDANLTVEIEGTKRNDDCHMILPEITGDDDCNSCDDESKRVRTSKSARHCTGDVFGTYTKRTGFITINDVGEIEFECCE